MAQRMWTFGSKTAVDRSKAINRRRLFVVFALVHHLQIERATGQWGQNNISPEYFQRAGKLQHHVSIIFNLIDLSMTKMNFSRFSQIRDRAKGCSDMGTVDNVRLKITGKQCERERSIAENGAILAIHFESDRRMGRRIIGRHRFEARDNFDQVWINRRGYYWIEWLISFLFVLGAE